MSQQQRHSHFWEDGKGKWIQAVIEQYCRTNEVTRGELDLFAKGVVECMYASDHIDKDVLVTLLQSASNALMDAIEVINDKK